MTGIRPDSQPPFILIKGEKINLDDLKLDQLKMGESRGGRYVQIGEKKLCKLNELVESMVSAARRVKVKDNLQNLEQTQNTLKTLEKLEKLSDRIKELDKSEIKSPILHTIRSLIPNWWFNRTKVINSFDATMGKLMSSIESKKEVYLNENKDLEVKNKELELFHNERIKYTKKYNEYVHKYKQAKSQSNSNDPTQNLAEFKSIVSELDTLEEEVSNNCKNETAKDQVKGLINYLKDTIKFEISHLNNQKT